MSVSFVAGVVVVWFIAMAGAWAVQRVVGNSGWIDVTWTLATGVISAGSIFAERNLSGDSLSARDWIVAGLLAVWALRLGGHIMARTLRGIDDPRYARLVEEWGERAGVRLFFFVQVQSVAGLLLTGSALAAAANRSSLGPLDLIGALVGAGALAGEAIADAQLRRCAARDREAKQKTVCEAGLWAWSRHPNYFFEFLFWCALPPMAFSGAGWSSPAFLSLLAPAMMYWLLARVSGVPPLEEHMLRSRGAAFADYQRRVSAFFPFPPKAKKASS